MAMPFSLSIAWLDLHLRFDAALHACQESVTGSATATGHQASTNSCTSALDQVDLLNPSLAQFQVYSHAYQIITGHVRGRTHR